jgi:hypothetical protein
MIDVFVTSNDSGNSSTIDISEEEEEEDLNTVKEITRRIQS